MWTKRDKDVFQRCLILSPRIPIQVGKSSSLSKTHFQEMLVWGWVPSMGSSTLSPCCRWCISEASSGASYSLLPGRSQVLLCPFYASFWAQHLCSVSCSKHLISDFAEPILKGQHPSHTWWQKFGGVANVIIGRIFHPGHGNDLRCDLLATTESLTLCPKTFVVHNAKVFNSTSIKCNFLFCSFFNKWEKKNESP